MKQQKKTTPVSANTKSELLVKDVQLAMLTSGVAQPQVLSDSDVVQERRTLLGIKKRRLDEERGDSLMHSTEGVVMSDVTGTVVAQIDPVLMTGATGSASGTAAGAAAATSTAGLSAAGVSGAAAGAAGATSALAASSVTAVTATSLSTAATVGSVSSLASIAGGAVALGAAGGGGGGSTPTTTTPPTLPPANPYPGAPGSDPATLAPASSSSADTRAVHRLSVVGMTLPETTLNKSLVVDLGATYGPLQSTLFFTDKTGDVVTTHVVAYRDIANIDGTSVNDQIGGNAGVNVLNGGAGDDIIYGDGGRDVLIGGAGQDWVLFRPLTRGGGAGPYDDGVYVNLAGTDLPGVVGIYRSASQTGGLATQASGFEHVVGSLETDTLIGNDGANMLVGFDGDDWIDGAAGNDHLFGGASGTYGNQLLGGAGKDVFWAGYDLNPVLRALTITGTTELLSSPNAFDPLADGTGVSTVINTSVVRDWDAANDGLRVSTSAALVIGGLSGVSGWTGDDTVDLRSSANNLGVENLGVIKVAAGAGHNQTYTTSGAEQLWVGYNYVANQDGAVYGQGANTVIDGVASPTASGNATDVIWGWDDQTQRRDELHVASGSVAVIGSLQSMNPASATRWDGANTVDLRGAMVSNNGSVVVSAGAGNNSIYGSSGRDVVYGSSDAGSYDQIWAGLGADVFNVGTRLDAATTATSTVASKDLLWDLDLASDTLNVSTQGTAVIAMLSGMADWSGINNVNLTGANNAGTIVIALGAGNDRILGSGGQDVVYGGSSTQYGNQLWGGAGSNQFYVGYNYNALAGALNEASGRSELAAGESGVDVIHDWQNEVDALTIGLRGLAVIGGLAGMTDWSGNDTLNVSMASNAGLIKLSAGTGSNKLYLSAGVDQIWSGYQFARTGTTSNDFMIDGSANPGVASSASVDVLWGWDDSSNRRDQLNVSTQGRAVIASLSGMGPTSLGRWDGNDVIDLRSQVNNAGLIDVAVGAGSNTIYGSVESGADWGNDHFHVGYIANADGTFTSSGVGAAVDTIYGWNARAWSDLPFAGAFNGTDWNGTEVSDSGYDRLTVAVGSVARIGSLSGANPTDATRWDGSQTVDLRASDVHNLNMTGADGGGVEVWTGAGNDYIYGSSGRDLIYSGAGADNLWGGAGNDVFYAGYSPSWVGAGADAAEPRIWDWQNGTDAAHPGDALRISANSYAVIAGLWDNRDQPYASRWSGNDTVDLRWDVQNYGKIIVESSDGNDTIYGSSEIDWINPGAGYNSLDLSNGGVDRIYLDNFLTRTQIKGFSADDKIYLDTRVLQSFIDQLGINTPVGYSITASASNAASSISSGQYYDKGSFFTSQKTYDATFNGVLQAYSSNPKDPDFNVYGGTGDAILQFGWASNGAWSNDAYYSAYLTGKIAVIGAGAASIAIGSSLAGIPFVGPILAIPFWVNGGLMLNDGINNVHAYQNPVYSGGLLGTGASTITAGGLQSSTVGAWDQRNFLDFYGVNSSGGYMPSLEIAGQQPGYTAIPSGATVPGTNITFPYTYYQAPALTGVASYLAVYDGTNGTDGETFIYLVASRDSLIQNSEAILIAQVNGRVTADQMAMYNGSTDAEYLRYFQNAVQSPVFPSSPTIDATAITATVGDGKQVLYRVAYTLNSASVTDYVTKSAYDALVANSAGSSPTVSNLSLQGAYTNETVISVAVAFDKAMLPTDQLDIYIGSTLVTSVTGQTGTSYAATLDISAFADGVNTITAVVSNSQGFVSQGVVSFVRDTIAPNTTDTNSSMVVVTDTATGIIVTSNEPGYARLGGAAVKLTDDAGNQGTFTVAEQSTATTVALSVEDIFGLSSALGAVTLGTGVNDALSSAAQYVYGFGGNDVLTSTYGGANNLGASFYGGVGNDTLIGASGKNNTFFGGAGQDVLDLNGGDNTLIFNTVATGTPASDSSAPVGKDHVYDFRSGHDALMVVASGVKSVEVSSALLHTISDLLNGGTATFTQMGISLDGVAGVADAGDLLLELAGSFSDSDILSALHFNLTGTSGADTLSGGVNADTFTGGNGADTFAFVAGASTPVISSDKVQGYDVITDLQVGVDVLDLSGTPIIASNTAGTDGADSGAIKSHSITNGLLTFGGADTYASALGATAFTLADALNYLHANIAGNLQTVVFNQDSHSYVFQHTATSDLLVQLSNVTTVAGLTDTAHPVTNYLFIA